MLFTTFQSFIALFFISIISLPSYATIDEEVEYVYGRVSAMLNSQEYDLYFQRDSAADEVRDGLIELFGKKSRLFSFPNLDIETFGFVIPALFKYHDESSPATTVMTWSLLGGIPVLGLNSRSEYFYDNKHILPGYYGGNHTEYSLQPDPVVRFPAGNICAKATRRGDGSIDETTEPFDSIEHAHFNIYLEEAKSILFYRSNYGKIQLDGEREHPLLIADLLRPSTVPLSAVAKDTLNKFVSSLLRIGEDGHPLYSLGLLSILRNTAVYFSLEDGPGRVIVSPSSVATVGYLGLMDGIFLEGPSITADNINYLMGIQLFRRSLFDRYPSQYVTVAYSPGMDVSQHVKDGLRALEAQGFARKFLAYASGREEEREEPLLDPLIQELDKQQLAIPLRSAIDSPWFPAEEEITASGAVLYEKFGTRISDDSIIEAIIPGEGETLLPVSGLLKHMTCYDYQIIRTLDLSGNYICDEGGAEIAHILARNVMPALEVLDLRNNRISGAALEYFIPLLKKNKFRYLVMTSNSFGVEDLDRLIPVDSSERGKLIWLREAWVSGDKQDHILECDYKNHRDFYGCQL